MKPDIMNRWHRRWSSVTDMAMIRLYGVFVTVSITVLLGLAACAPSPTPTPSLPPDVVGRWKLQGKPGLNVPNSFFWFSMDYLEFRDDGTVWGLMRWPPGDGDEIRLNKMAQYTLRGENRIEFVGSCRHQDPCTDVYTLTRTAGTLQIFDGSNTLTLQWVAPPAKTLPPPAPGPAPSPRPTPAKHSALKQQLTQIHAPFEFDLSGCFITNQAKVPYSYESAIEQMVTLLVSHPAQLALDERVAIFKDVAGFEVALFEGPDDAVLAAYPGNRGCPLGSHHFPGSRVAVVERAGNYRPGAVGRAQWIEDRWVLLANHKLNTFSGPDPAGVWHIGRQNEKWQRLVTHEFDPPPYNFREMAVRFEQGYAQMVVEMSHWGQEPPCRFNQTFEQRFVLVDWRVEKRYRLAGNAYELLSATALEVNVLHKATHEPAAIEWSNYCVEIPVWLTIPK